MSSKVLSVGLVISATGTIAGFLRGVRKDSEDLKKSLASIGVQRKAVEDVQKLGISLQAVKEHAKAADAAFDKAGKRLSQGGDLAERLRLKLKLAEGSGSATRVEIDRLKDALSRADRVTDQFKDNLDGAKARSTALRVEVEKAGNALERATKRAQELKLNVGNPAATASALAAHERSMQWRQGGRMAREQGKALRADAYGSIAGTVATAYSASKIAEPFMAHQDALRDIAITGNLNDADETALGRTIRDAAVKMNQKHRDLTEGVQVLVANGMSVPDARQYTPLLARTATATRASMDDLANLTFSLQNSMKIKGEAEMKNALDMLNHAGKQGQFELRHMARYFPELGAQMASFGATGIDAVKELGAAMQVARKYAGTTEEAARNTANWFSHMSAAGTIKHFSDIGIDYKGEVFKKMNSGRGISAMQATLEVVDDYIDKVAGGKVIAIKDKKGRVKEQIDFRSALAQASTGGNEEEVRSLIERFGLSRVLQDMQTVNFYLAMRQGKGTFRDIMGSYSGADAQDSIDRDFARRVQSAREQMKSLGVALHDMAIEIGTALTATEKKPLTEATDQVERKYRAKLVEGEGAGDSTVKTLTDYVKGLKELAAEHPKVVKGIAIVAGGLAALSVSMMAGKFLLGGAMSIGGGIAEAWGWLRGKKTARDVQKVYVVNMGSDALPDLGGGKKGRFGRLGRAASRGWAAGKGFVVSGAASLLSKLGGGAGAAIHAMRDGLPAALQIGARALGVFMGPVGWAVLGATALASAAYAIYRNWDTIGPKLGAVWQSVTGFVRNFASAGAELVNGFIGGIASRFSSVGDTMRSLGAEAISTIKSVLGIKSPSRAFMEVGGFVSEGAALGIARRAGLVKNAAAGLAGLMIAAGTPAQTNATVPDWALAAAIPFHAADSITDAGRPITIHYAPRIEIKGSASSDDLVRQLEEVLRRDKADLERTFEQKFLRMLADQQRRSYGDR